MFQKFIVVGCALSFAVLGSACTAKDFFDTMDNIVSNSNHKHNLKFYAACESTCTVKGHNDFWYCDDYKCKKYFSDAEGKNQIEKVYFPLLPHTMQFYEGTEATCTSTGIRSYYKCTSCNNKFWDEQGSSSFYDDDYLIIDKKPHQMEQRSEKPSTCGEAGEKAHYYCTVCQKKYKYNIGVEMTDEELALPLLEHSVSELWSSDEDEHWHMVFCGHDELSGREKHTDEGGVCTVCKRRLYSIGLTYELHADGKSAKVTGKKGTCTDSAIYIASSYENVPVTEIESGAFSSDTAITEIYMPSTLTAVGDNAFSNCSKLSKITFSKNLETIGASAFYNTAVKDLSLPNSVTSVGESAFAGCLKMEEFYANGATIGARALQGCTALKKVVLICYGKEIIGEYAFSNCTALETLNMYGVKEIQDYAFYCANIKSVKIPSSVTLIGERAFGSCAKLESVAFFENSKLTTIGAKAFMNCTALTRVDIPSSVVTIEAEAFDTAGLHIYTGANSKPRGWATNWKTSDVTVHWGEYNN